MQFATVLIGAAALLSSSALAAPTSASSSSYRPGGQQNPIEWTIRSLRRTCTPEDSECAWSFSIQDLDVVHICRFNVHARDGKPASQTDLVDAATCGPFAITTGWSLFEGQPGTGFTTMGMVKGSLIAYPSYSDSEIPKDGTSVKPDKKFVAGPLP
jgi:hypothetical protein